MDTSKQVRDWQGDLWVSTGEDTWTLAAHLDTTRPGFTPLTASTGTLDQVYGPVHPT